MKNETLLQYCVRKYQIFVCVLILCILCPILVLGTRSLGFAAAYNSDIIGYVESFKRIYTGLKIGNIEYALEFNTFGYGAGFFVALAPFTTLIQFLFMSDRALLLFLRLSGVIFLLGSLVCLRSIIRYLLPVGVNTTNATRNLWLLFTIVLLLYPATIMLVTRIHPEMLQFFLFTVGIWLLFKCEDTGKKRYFILGTVAFGIMLSVKISGIIFFVVPFCLIFFDNGDLKKKLKKTLFFTVAAFFIALAFISPISIYRGDFTFSQFRNELAYFSKSLVNSSISDFDNYVPLSSRAEVVKAWLTYAFSHGYLQIPGVVVMLCVIIYSIVQHIRKREYSKLSRFNIGVLGCFLLNIGYYLLMVTRVSVYYYYMPMCLLTLCFVIDIYIIYTSHQHRVLCKFLIPAILVLSLIPSVAHVGKMYAQQHRLDRDLYTVSYRYNDLKGWLCGRRYPFYSILLPISMPLDMTAEDVNWIPQANELSIEERAQIGTEGGYLCQWGYYWTFDDVWSMTPASVINADVFVIDKMATADYSATDFILRQQGKSVIYKDNFVVAYGNTPLSEVDPTLNIEIQNVADNLPPIVLNPSWNGTNIFFSEPKNLDDYDEVVLSFDLKNAEAIQEVRLVFNGSRMDNIENAWHKMIHSDLLEGRNLFCISKEDFVLSTGYIDWFNVTNIGIGGIGSAESEISNISVKLR